jgi:hypothetical protein
LKQKILMASSLLVLAAFSGAVRTVSAADLPVAPVTKAPVAVEAWNP